MDFATLVPSITSIGSVCAIAYLIYREYKSGSRNLTKEISDGYKERNGQLEATLTSLQDQITTQGKEIARLSGVIQEKDKHIESLTRLIENRNPELLELLSQIKTSNTEVTTFMKLAIENFQLVRNELAEQTKMLEETKDRNEQIDIAHGVAARKPHAQNTQRRGNAG